MTNSKRVKGNENVSAPKPVQKSNDAPKAMIGSQDAPTPKGPSVTPTKSRPKKD